MIQQGEVSREKGHWSQGRVKHSKLGHETTRLLSLVFWFPLASVSHLVLPKTCVGSEHNRLEE